MAMGEEGVGDSMLAKDKYNFHIEVQAHVTLQVGFRMMS